MLNPFTSLFDLAIALIALVTCQIHSRHYNFPQVIELAAQLIHVHTTIFITWLAVRVIAHEWNPNQTAPKTCINYLTAPGSSFNEAIWDIFKLTVGLLIIRGPINWLKRFIINLYQKRQYTCNSNSKGCPSSVVELSTLGQMPLCLPEIDLHPNFGTQFKNAATEHTGDDHERISGELAVNWNESTGTIDVTANDSSAVGMDFTLQDDQASSTGLFGNDDSSMVEFLNSSFGLDEPNCSTPRTSSVCQDSVNDLTNLPETITGTNHDYVGTAKSQNEQNLLIGLAAMGFIDP